MCAAMFESRGSLLDESTIIMKKKIVYLQKGFVGCLMPGN